MSKWMLHRCVSLLLRTFNTLRIRLALWCSGWKRSLLGWNQRDPCCVCVQASCARTSLCARVCVCVCVWWLLASGPDSTPGRTKASLWSAIISHYCLSGPYVSWPLIKMSLRYLSLKGKTELIFGIMSCTVQQSPLNLVILRPRLIGALFPSSSTELFLDTQGPHEPFSAIVPRSCSLWRNNATQRSSSFDSLR